MRIVGLSIKRYKTVTAPLELGQFGHVHIFIGPNESGKTTLLDALNLGRSVDGQRISTREPYEFSLVVSHNHQQRTFTLNSSSELPAYLVELYRQHTIRLSATQPIEDSRIHDDLASFSQQNKSQFLEFLATLSRYFPHLRDSRFLDKQNWAESGEQSLLKFEEYGSGFRQIFVTLLYLFHPQFHVVFLDEPEIHLHPSLIKKLLHVMYDHSLDNQIFMTTHSPVCIQPRSIHQIYRVARSAEGGTRVFTMRSSPIHVDRMRLEQELNSDNTEMFLADEVLLVEGVSDRLLMRGLIDRFYTGEKDIKVIYVEGKTNMEIYTDLLDLFSIPRVLMLDDDALKRPLSSFLQRFISVPAGSDQETVRRQLKKRGIYILPIGGIERHYPRQYQVRRRKKPLNALIAASRITPEQYTSPEMSSVREVIEHL